MHLIVVKRQRLLGCRRLGRLRFRLWTSGRPKEVAQERQPISLAEVKSIVDDLMSLSASNKRKSRAAALRNENFPSSLMDTDIGDETLVYFLQDHYWTRFCKTVGRKTEKAKGEAENLLSAIAEGAI